MKVSVLFQSLLRHFGTIADGADTFQLQLLIAVSAQLTQIFRVEKWLSTSEVGFSHPCLGEKTKSFFGAFLWELVARRFSVEAETTIGVAMLE